MLGWAIWRREAPAADLTGFLSLSWVPLALVNQFLFAAQTEHMLVDISQQRAVMEDIERDMGAHIAGLVAEAVANAVSDYEAASVRPTLQ